MSETTTNIIGALADIRTYIEEKFDFDDPQTENLMIGLACRLDGLSDALAGLATREPGAGGEWQLVPHNPTEDMIESGLQMLFGLSERNGPAELYETWRAMLAAAPQA